MLHVPQRRVPYGGVSDGKCSKTTCHDVLEGVNYKGQQKIDHLLHQRFLVSSGKSILRTFANDFGSSQRMRNQRLGLKSPNHVANQMC